MSTVDPLIEVYVYENMQLLEHLENMLLNCEKKASLNKEQIDEVFRVMHTIKGSSGMMAFDNVAKLAHGVEDMFSNIREKRPADSQWAKIFDIVLEAIDFFKVEIDKIQEGQQPDGDLGDLLSRIVVEVKALVSGEEPKVSETAPPKTEAPSLTPEIIQETESLKADAGEKVYYIKVNFEPACGMESVRAFGLVMSLNGMYSQVSHIPADIEVNCDEEISVNGFVMYLVTSTDIEIIKHIINQTLFVDTYELNEMDLKETPFEEETMPEEIKADIPKEEPVNTVVQEISPQTVPETVQKKSQANEPAAEKTAKQNFISVNVNKIDKLMNLVGEIVTTESMVTKNPDIADMHLENFEKQARQLRKLTDELQDVVMSIRMVPISSTFHKMQRIVRDMCKKVSKEARLVIIGENTEVDKNVNDNLSDPLMHLIRNSMDHGLETPEERIAAGKDPVGTITLEARNTGGDVIVLVSDDGRGLNKHKLIQKAINNGLTFKTETEISDKEAYGFILAPGFSTKDEVTEFSGRGVGMDVVHRNIENIGGTLSVDSEEGKGMSVKMHIPLTLAIVDGMKIAVGESQFIVPILNIKESIEPRLHQVITNPDGGEVAIIRGNCYEIIRLHELFDIEAAATELNEGIMLVVESEGGTACLFVDQLIGEQQAVIKPMPVFISKYIGRLKGISGCTILGDGSISLILDINSLLS